MVSATSCPAPTRTSSDATATAAETFISTTQSAVALDCPNVDGTTQFATIDSIKYNFALTCGQDFPPDTGKNSDLVALVAYSLSDCFRACASYNFNLGGAASAGCKAVSFTSNLAQNVASHAGNCWLKNSTLQAYTANKVTQVTAELLPPS